MVINPHLLHQTIGLLSQNNILIAQVQTLLPHATIFKSTEDIITNSFSILLIDDDIIGFEDAIYNNVFHDIVIILLADVLSADRLTQALDAGVSDYIPKPLSSKLLEHRLSQIARHIEPVTPSDPHSSRMLISNFPDALVTTDTNYIVTNWNKSAEQLYGWQSDQVIGQRLYGLLPTIYVGSTREDVMKALSSGKTWRGELIQSNKFGEKIHTLVSISCIFDDWGEIRGHISLAWNNTDYQASIEKSLENTETEYQSIIASMTDPVFVFDSKGTYLKVPKVDTPNYFVSPDDVIGKTLQDVFPTESMERFIDAIQRAITTQSSQVIYYDLLIGTRRTYFSAVINPIKGRDEVVWVSRDITHVKLNELALSETEERYKQFFEHANDMILMVELETGRVIDANKQVQKQLGYSRSELLKMNIRDVEQPLKDIQSRIVTRTLATSGNIIVEQTYNTKDGLTIPVEISARLIDYQGQKVVLSFARNIKQRKMAMEAQADEYTFTQALSDSISQLASALTLNDVLDVMIETVSKVVGSKSVNIMLVENDIATIERASDDSNPAYEGVEMHIPSTTTLNHMKETQQALIISDISTDPRWMKNEDRNTLKSYLGAPIILKGKLIGYINLDGNIPHYFKEKHQQRIQAFADQAAIAIENARLYETSQRYTEDLEVRVLERTAEFAKANKDLTEQIIKRQEIEVQLAEERNLLRNIVNNIPVTVYVKDRQGKFVMFNRFPFIMMKKQPIIGKSDLDLIENKEIAQTLFEEEQKLMETGEILSHEAYQKGESGDEYWTMRTKIPFRDDKGNVVGLVGVNQNITQIKLAESILRESHDRLEQRVKERTEDLYRANKDLLHEIAIRQNAEQSERQQRIVAEALQDSISALNNTLNIDDVLDAVLDAMKLTVEHDASNIMLIEGETLTIVRQRGYPSQLPNSMSLKSIRDIPIVYESKKPIVINDTQLYDLWDGNHNVHGEVDWVRSNIKIPIIDDGRVIGILLLDDAEPSKFTMEHANLLQTFANQTSIALQNARLYQAERDQRVLAETLQNTIQAMNKTLNIDDVLDTVLVSMNFVVENDASNIMLIEGDTLKTVRHRGYKKDLPEFIPLTAFRNVKLIQEDRQPVIISDTHSDDAWKGIGDVSWIRCNIKVPIIDDEIVIGIINVDSSEPYKYTTEHARLAQTFANQASIALRNARLYQQAQQEIAKHKLTQQLLQRRSAELELLRQASLELNATFDLTTIFKITADYTLRLVNADCINLFLYDGEVLHFGIALWNNIYQDHPYMPIRSNGITYSTARTGDVLIVNSMVNDEIYDNKRIDGAIASIPLKVQGLVRGVMNISYFTPHQFTDDELRAMGLLADQSAIAIQNSEHLRLLETEIQERKRAESAEREQRVFAETLRDTAITLNQQLNTDDLYETIIQAIEQVITVHDTASIITMSTDGMLGTIVKDRGFEKFGGSLRGLAVDFSGSEVRQILIEDMQPVLINDTQKSDIWISVEATTWIRSHISLPIYIKDDILALINLDSQYVNTFTQDHVDRLIVFSHQAAIALRNAQLVEQIQGYTLELESRVKERTLELEDERVLLQLEQSQLRAILDGMRDGVYYTDHTHQPTYINNALSEMTGYSTDDWLSGRVFEQINQDEDIERDELWGNVERHLNVNQFWHGESSVTCADGTQFRASLTRTEVKDIDNKRVGIVTVVRNISLQKQLEEQKSRFIANAAHELRTPITNIKTRLFLIRHKPEKLLEHLTIAESATNWMQSLVDNLFDQSRFERGIIRLEVEEFILQDLMSIVVETQQPEASRKDIQIISEWDESLIRVQGDVSRLRQVLTNLINNAINYTPNNGRITIMLREEIAVTENRVIISVQDTGIGIDTQHLPHLFQPFYQASDDSKGAGLGLSIAREIMELHKGTIHVASKLNEGTTFSINLPILPAPTFSEES
jgi:PAS domain S-box-containing protein